VSTLVDTSVSRIRPHMVKYAIEVKKPSEIKMGIKEAVVQLIGLNVGNVFTRPLVILTDFLVSSDTFELENYEGPTGETRYRTKRHSFGSFHEAVAYAECVSSRNLPSFDDFGRGVTPLSSPERPELFMNSDADADSMLD
jgi:hypothetical protein